MKIELSKGKFSIEEEGIDVIIRDLLLNELRTKTHHIVQPESQITSTKTEIRTEDATDTEYKYSTTLTDTSSGMAVDIKKTYGVELSDKDSKEKVICEKVKDEKVKDETTKKNIMAVVKEAFETKLDEMKNPNRFNTGQVAITMGTLDKPDIDQIADIDKDIVGYDRIRVFDSMERKCDITIINDGSDSLYFIVNRNGIDHEEEMWSQAELMLYPGEAWKIFDVHELRIRSETQGTKYRITEDDIIVGSTIRSVT